MKAQEKMPYPMYEIIFEEAPNPTLWCEIHDQPIRRDRPIELDTGRIVRARAGFCYKCEHNIINGGSCGPV